MKSMKARVAERGQVTIPKRLRERLGVKPGRVLVAITNLRASLS